MRLSIREIRVAVAAVASYDGAVDRLRPLDGASLASFSRELRRIDDYERLVELVRAHVEERFGLTNAWLYVFEREEDAQAVLVAVAGPKAEAIRKELPV